MHTHTLSPADTFFRLPGIQPSARRGEILVVLRIRPTDLQPERGLQRSQVLHVVLQERLPGCARPFPVRLSLALLLVRYEQMLPDHRPATFAPPFAGAWPPGRDIPSRICADLYL